MSRDDGYREEDSGVSPIVATIVLILATLYIGGVAFIAFRSQTASLTKNANIMVRSADLITASSSSMFSVAVKNTGTVSLDNIEVRLLSLTTISLGSSEPGQTVSGSEKLSADAVFAGEKKIVEITGFIENNAVIKRLIVVTAHG